MPKNKIDDLRNHLFATLEDLRDPEKPMELDRAKTIADVGRAIIESAKVENDFLKITGATRATDFLPEGERGTPPAPRRLSARTPQMDGAVLDALDAGACSRPALIEQIPLAPGQTPHERARALDSTLIRLETQGHIRRRDDGTYELVKSVA